MAQPSPTKLNTSRNLALRHGTASGGFAEPDIAGMLPIVNDDVATQAQPKTHGGVLPGTPAPFRITGGR